MGPGVRRDDKSMEACTGLDLSKRKLDVADVVLDQIVRHLETEIPAQVEHGGVFREYVARDNFKSFRPGVFDDQLHQRPAKSPALEIRPQQDRVFPAPVD